MEDSHCCKLVVRVIPVVYFAVTVFFSCVIQRSIARVQWSAAGENVYRVGHKGKVMLILVLYSTYLVNILAKNHRQNIRVDFFSYTVRGEPHSW